MFNVKKYSKTGDAHKRNNQQCQDITFTKENARFTVAALADGVSSCENSREGAKVACETVAEFLLQLGELLYSYSETKISFLVVEEVKCCLKKLAEKAGNSIESYASTLSFCCVDKTEGKVIVFNLGDSAAIVTTDAGENLTIESCDDTAQVFTTSHNAYKKASVKFYDMADIDIDKIFLCSDGVLKNIIANSYVSESFKKILASSDYGSIEKLIESGGRYDDRSYLSMDFGGFDK